MENGDALEWGNKHFQKKKRKPWNYDAEVARLKLEKQEAEAERKRQKKTRRILEPGLKERAVQLRWGMGCWNEPDRL